MIRKTLEAGCLEVESIEDCLRVTASFSVAQYQKGETIDNWMKRADSTL